MKKILILVLFIFVLTGCSNSITIDFNDKIDTVIDLSFDKSDFEKNVRKLENSESLEYAVEDILIEARPIVDNYDEMFEKEYFKVNSDKLEAKYKYTYTYDNFVNNDLFNKCFDYPVVEDLGDRLAVYLSGTSKCGAFTLNVTANKRLINSNSDSVENGKYIWNIRENNNDIKFTISKSIIKNKVNVLEILLYVILAVVAVVGVILFSKHLKKKIN